MNLSAYGVRFDHRDVGHFVLRDTEKLGFNPVPTCRVLSGVERAAIVYYDHAYPTCLWCASIEFQP